MSGGFFWGGVYKGFVESNIFIIYYIKFAGAHGDFLQCSHVNTLTLLTL